MDGGEAGPHSPLLVELQLFVFVIRAAYLLWFVSWELDCASCFSKIPKYDKPLLRRIFRRGTNNNTISKDINPVQRSKYLTALIHSWHSMLLYYSQTVSAIATATCDLRAAALLLFEAMTLPPR